MILRLQLCIPTILNLLFDKNYLHVILIVFYNGTNDTLSKQVLISVYLLIRQMCIAF